MYHLSFSLLIAIIFIIDMIIIIVDWTQFSNVM